MTSQTTAAGARIKKVTVRKSPNGRHLYYASEVRGNGTYGWGNTPAEARAKLTERNAMIEAERAALAKTGGA